MPMDWRIAIRFAGYLLLGTMLSVLVAWICTVMGPDPFGTRFDEWDISDARAKQLDLFDLIHTPDGKPVHWVVYGGLGWMHAVNHTLDEDMHFNRGFWTTPDVRRAGWPCYAVESRVTQIVEYKGVSYPERWQLPLAEIVRR